MPPSGDRVNGNNGSSTQNENRRSTTRPWLAPGLPFGDQGQECWIQLRGFFTTVAEFHPICRHLAVQYCSLFQETFRSPFSRFERHLLSGCILGRFTGATERRREASAIGVQNGCFRSRTCPAQCEQTQCSPIGSQGCTGACSAGSRPCRRSYSYRSLVVPSASLYRLMAPVNWLNSSLNK
jgi:hypothetical protein